MSLSRRVRPALNFLLAVSFLVHAQAFAASPKPPKGSVIVSSSNAADFLALGKEGRNSVLCRVQGTKNGLLDVGYVKKDPKLKKKLWKSFKTVINEIKKNRSLTSKQRKKQVAAYTKLQTKYLDICTLQTAPTATATASSTPTLAATATATATASATPTATASPTATATATATATPTESPTATATPTGTATATATPTATVTPTATPTSTPPDTAIWRLNSGGPGYTDLQGRTWTQDLDDTLVLETSVNQLSDHEVAGTADPMLYQLYRRGVDGARVEYEIPVPGGTYDVILHLSELVYTSPGQRVFDVYSEGLKKRANLDIFTLAGGADRATTVKITSTVADGFLSLSLRPLVDQASISAIEVRPTGGTPADDLFRINCGSDDEYTDTFGFVWNQGAGDGAYVLGNSQIFANSAAAVQGTDDPTLFQSERYGKKFTYGLPVPNGSYQVTMGFAEIFFSDPGSRVFDVSAEGNPLLSEYDIVADPQGGALSAVTKTFQVSVTDGELDIEFARRVNNAKISNLSVSPLNLAVSPSFHDFGNQAAGTTSAAFAITLKNSSASTITVSDVSLVGADATQFVLTAAPPYVLSANQQVEVQVAFAPTVISTNRQVSLEITTDDTSAAGGLYQVQFRGHSEADIAFMPPETLVNTSIPGMANFSRPTTLQVGPDGKLYVGQLDGHIYVLTLDPVDHSLDTNVPPVIIDSIYLSGNQNADGSPATYDPDPNDPNNPLLPVLGRVVTGLYVAGTASQPVLYVTHSDARIGGLQGTVGPDEALKIDTDGGVLTRLIGPDFDTPANRVDLVTGLPRSRENHGPNAIQIHDGWAYVATGGNSNWGGTVSPEFSNMPEVNLSAAILRYRLPESLSDPVTTYDASAGSQIGSLPGDGEQQNVFEVYATGYRNAYDFLWHSNGRMYANVNAGNPGFGEAPNGHPTEYACIDRNFVEPDPGLSPLDMLFLINPNDYGGHPVPARGYCILDDGSYYSPAVAPDLGYHAPIHLYGGPVRPQSVNGIAEYISTSAFGGQMFGDIISAVSYQPNQLRRVRLNADGSQVISDTVIADGMNFGPLDVTVIADGTIFAVGFFDNTVMILRPAVSCPTPSDLDCDGTPDATDGDDDGDGFTDVDEIFSGSDPRNPASRPPDFDGDFIGDPSDSDDDNDGIADINDRFIFDAANGEATTLPINFSWNPGTPALGKLRGTGFTGYLLHADGTGFIPAKVSQGGAGGFMSITPTAGTFSDNLLDDALQIGLDSSALGLFTISTSVTDPFRSGAPLGAEAIGAFISSGVSGSDLDQDNFIRLTVTGNTGGSGAPDGIQLSAEVAGVAFENLVPPFALTLPDPNTTGTIELYLTLNPTNQTVTASYRINSGTIVTLGTISNTELPGISRFFAPSVGAGVYATRANQATSPFVGVFDYFNVKVGGPS